MNKGHISVQSENIFPIIKQFLYSDQDIFLRELVSNAVDAIQKLKTLSRKGEFKGSTEDLRIKIEIDPDKKTLTISDQGLGMTEEEVKKYLNQMALSSANDFLDKYKDEGTGIIGHFGLGFYSSFMVAKKVEVVTKSWQKDAKAVKWICEGEPEYMIEDATRDQVGTDVILHIEGEDEEYLEERTISDLLEKYCKFLPVPIQFGTKEVPVETATDESTDEAEDKAKEVETEEVPNIINNTHPLWKKNPTDLNDQDYLDFYDELYPYSDQPLFWIHLNIDFPFHLTGVLYFPKIHNQLEVQKNKIHLYSNQVYVTDEVKEIVPEFLTLLHGVIDSPDIPLNVSRSALQSDRNVKKITGYITKKVADKLKELYNTDREQYEAKWEDIGVFIKYGMISDEKFYDRVKDIVLLKSTEGEYHTIDAYLDKIKDSQTDKNDVRVVIYTFHKDAQDSYVTAAQDYGYDVLLLDQVLDNHFIQTVEQKWDKVRFVRVDSETVDQLVAKDEEKETALSEKEQEKIKGIFKDVLSLDDHRLEIRPLPVDAAPVQIVKPEFMRRMEDMQRMQSGQLPGQGLGMHQIVINGNHPLIAQKLNNMRSEEKKVDFTKYLYNLALLNQNMLNGKALTDFVKQSLDYANS
ncbi:molecular chaperone HtpG [Membranicola marinus]|uniref:Chaperone protein HtpG n=1 Tax=Membranihabitans marinus TaxID=1227546 RepID=A0A953HNF4_9BACT|nr:molecular chaperone HtpG [Membranihabitans marinus]MBY5958324.1 molecular chaperone HtpG [Membranihabitans marinus]